MLDLPNFEVPITVDPQKMISVFENLLENAFNHAKELSRITIRLKIIEKHTIARFARIEDDGQNTIAPAEIEKLFERFLQSRQKIAQRARVVRNRSGTGVLLKTQSEGYYRSPQWANCRKAIKERRAHFHLQATTLSNGFSGSSLIVTQL